MSTNQDPIYHIARQIETKSAIKQQVYRNNCEAFIQLYKEAHKVIKAIKKQVHHKDKDIELKVTSVNDHEFHVTVAGDLLVFFMHTNVVVLDDKHGYNHSEQVKDKEDNKYLGQINIYNFMADTFRFNRLKDPGYLIARMFINVDNHFLVEGERQLNFMFDKVSQQPLTETDLSVIIQLAISQCVDNNLVTPAFPSIRVITLSQKIEKTMDLGAGYKIGFQMSYQQDLKS